MVVMVSCKKEEAVKPSVVNNSTISDDAKTSGSTYKIFFNSGGGYYCLWSGGNCLTVRDIIAYREISLAKNAIISLDNAIRLNTVSDFFTNGNWKVLFPGISAEHLSLLQKTQVTLEKHDNGVDASPRFIYLASNNAGDFVFAMEIPNL